MKSNNKRTSALKELINQGEKAKGNSLLQLKDDLVDIDQSTLDADIKNPHLANTHIILMPSNKHQDQIDSKALLNKSDLRQSIALFERLIAKELESVAAQLGIENEELQAWINLQIEVPAKTILSLLRTAKETGLDPLKEEIGFIQYEDGNWQVFITLNGCSKILNQHLQFNGLLFSQSDTLIDGVPEWIECSIYRRDRIFPITVREYFIEVKAKQASWQKMPRQMLRHRTLQQCIRLAMS